MPQNKTTSRVIKKSKKPTRVHFAKSWMQSRPVQLAFIGIFAGVAAVLLIKSFAAAPSPSIVCPFDGHPGITSPYGDSRSTHTHAGIDIFVSNGTPIYASMDGNLEGQSKDSSYSGGKSSGGYGYYVDLVNGSYRFRYGHISKVARGAGPVKAGDLIAYSGDTGSPNEYHLHYEIRSPNSKTFGLQNTLDPAPSYNSCRQRGSGGTSSPSNHLPILNLDNANCNNIWGWAYDPDKSGASIPIHIYFDASAGKQGALGPYGIAADQASKDVDDAYQITGNHRFAMAIPDKFKDGQAHAVYVYAIDGQDSSKHTDPAYKAISGCRGSSTTPTNTTTTTPTNQAQSTPSSNTVVGFASNRCLDATGYGTSNGTKIQLWDCNGGSNQKWTVKSDGTIVGVGSGRCLDAAGNGSGNGTAIQLWDCNGGSNQKWQRNSNGSICSYNGGRCLDAAGNGSGNGTAIQLYDYLGGNNQKWSVR